MGNNSLSEDHITSLIRPSHCDRPRPVHTIPAYSLSVFLKIFRKVSFEPLSEISLANLTVKTVFLVALNSGVKRSDIHAIVHQGSGHFRVRVILSHNLTNFLAKSERLHRRDSKTIVIPALPWKDAAERTLCPVRALNNYCPLSYNRVLKTISLP